MDRNMKKWHSYKLSDVVRFNPSERLLKGEIAKKVPMDLLQPYTRGISGFEMASYTGGSKFRNGDTLMARITPCLENGKTAYVSMLDEDEVGFGSTEYIVFRNIEGITDNKFVYYFVTSPWFRDIAVKSMVGSSGRQRVQQAMLENLVVNLPPLAEQKQIAGILGALDDKIELNRCINDNLEEQAKALFKSWFVDNQEPTWEKKTLADIVNIWDSMRKPLSATERDKMQKIYPYYGATSLMDYVDNYLFDGIYLLMGEDGTVVDDKGFPILQYVYGKFWVNNHAHVLTGANGFSTECIYILLSTTNVKSIVTGAVQPKINQANLKNIPIVIPPEDVLSDYKAIIHPLFAKIRNNSMEIHRLTIIHDTLLPKLMSGELSVEEVSFD
mgnify:CR=1 FL=1